MSTYIKLYREILDNPRLSMDNNAYLMFTKLLLKVDRHTGTYTTGRKKLASLCNLKQTTAWMTLKRLNDDNMVDISSDRSKTKITICNWKKYQSKGDSLDDRFGVDLMTKRRGFDDTKQELRTKNKENNIDLLKQLITIINPKEKPTEERMRLLNGRLKDYNSSEIIGAAKAFSKSEWHKTNKQMSIDNLLAPTKFGRWFTASQESNTKFRGFA